MWVHLRSRCPCNQCNWVQWLKTWKQGTESSVIRWSPQCICKYQLPGSTKYICTAEELINDCGQLLLLLSSLSQSFEVKPRKVNFWRGRLQNKHNSMSTWVLTSLHDYYNWAPLFINTVKYSLTFYKLFSVWLAACGIHFHSLFILVTTVIKHTSAEQQRRQFCIQSKMSDCRNPGFSFLSLAICLAVIIFSPKSGKAWQEKKDDLLVVARLMSEPPIWLGDYTDPS